ncbi:hypothetical protein P4H66_13380 [Paenibacillus dokdonensis]|uniref:SWIM-type domain-containing protein n=1 Tax=Paenibacillus dokdonensis TaxID=2567944 RepID=A0ABU6GM58_9BACL|nr:hypothetical protein [Paenibacillus dokdonensis]MEC0240842.1 hypothetical protein [Paenibacillus dokdonensis]
MKREPFELSIVPGWIHAKEARSQKSNEESAETHVYWKVEIPCPQLTAEERTEICERLADHPDDVYGLLKNQQPSWLEEEIPADDVPRLDQAKCSCGQSECRHIQMVLETVEHKLHSEPLLRLTMLGITREQLLNFVFQEWAEEVPAVAESSDEEALSKLEEKGKSGPSSGEWLAEAAEQGKLHEPGSTYLDVKVHLNAIPDDELEMDDWTELLPNVKAVQQVIRQITLEAAGKARESLGSIKNSDG